MSEEEFSMNKKYVRFIFVIAIIALTFTNSCDSLWKIGETTSVSFSMDISEIIAKTEYNTMAINNHGVRSVENLQGQTVIVSLHNVSDDSLVVEQKNPLQGGFETIQVTFKNLTVGLHLYAKVIILEDNTIAFSARSESIKLVANDNHLVARTNAIFLDPINYSKKASDSNRGLTPDEPVLTLAKAVELLRKFGNYITGATVYLMTSLEREKDTTWNYGDIIIKRYGTNDFPMALAYNKDQTFNLGGATLDGNGVHEGFWINPDIDVTVKNGSITNTDTGLYNNGAVDVTISDMRITGNKIAMEGLTNLYLAGGTIIISGNTEKNVEAKTITLTANLSSTSLIGITRPDIEDENILVYKDISEDVQINPTNFFLNNYGAGEHLTVNKDGHLIYKP